MTDTNSISSQVIASGGAFIVDGKSMDLGSMLLELDLERTQQLDIQIADQMSEIKSRNDQIKGLNDQLKTKRDELAQLDPDKDKKAYTAKQGEIDSLKDQIDALNSDSQLAMTRMQQLVNKRNQCFEEASNMLQKDQKTRDTVVSNLR